jgi:hypothetical protein
MRHIKTSVGFDQDGALFRTYADFFETPCEDAEAAMQLK